MTSVDRSRVKFFILAAGLTALVGAGVVAQRGNTNPRVLPNTDSSNFMDFDQITKSNVKDLEVAWFYPYGSTVFSPVAVDGVLYGLGRNGSSLVALDATTGKEIWIHEGLNGMTSKGINFWQSADGKDRRLIFAVNSFLQAIDARTGKSILSFGQNGIVDMREGLLRAEGTALRAMPASPGRIWRNTIVFGGQSGEAFITPPGDIRAYDVVSGKRLWQFHTIPRPGEFGYETNPPDGWKYIGGANNWGEMSIDDERGIRDHPDRIGYLRLLRRGPARRQICSRTVPRTRRADRQADLALPDDSPRPLGPRQRVSAAACHRASERPHDSGSRPRGQDRIPVCLQSRDR